ncbi:hypothetical protein [Marinomonas transparens]|uniref:Histidine kinase N-terminal 7TM region domain-containing protein n=1 Tax=Marinomonas transparens TaxID=2795388 RepID=A0A934JLE6_9GAMM|nr:hypothetical protein [Marinomonas transparens]MBJ7537961.1 hypothetical protein [Marinomonas transparens]
MTWMLPSAIALVIKCFLFFYSNVHKKKNFFILLVLMFFLNFIEMISFLRLGYYFLGLKLYYCLAAFVALYLLKNCVEISNSFYFFKKDFLFIIACFLSGAILLSDKIVAGFYFLPNGSITRVAGEYYFIFQTYILSFLLCSIFILVKGAMAKKEYDVRSRCIVALLAFVPFIVIAIILMILMQLGYRVNMAGFLSLALCFMLFVFISLSEKHKLFTMMKFVPFSQERAHYLELKKHIEKLTLPAIGEYIDMKSVLKDVEMVVIRHTHHHANSQKEVARRLSLSESSLSKKMSKKS